MESAALYFEKTAVQSLRIELDAPGALGEVLVIGTQGAS